jgi:hypothetical protein
MKTVDIKFSQLCEEIDYWKSEAQYWKEMHDKINREHNEFISERLTESKVGIGNALMLLLATNDLPNGDIVIKKEDRKMLAGRYK